jgi:hypothetical protein
VHEHTGGIRRHPDGGRAKAACFLTSPIANTYIQPACMCQSISAGIQIQSAAWDSAGMLKPHVRTAPTRVAFCMKPSTRLGQPASGLAAAPLRAKVAARQGRPTTARIVRVRVRHHARVEVERSRLGLLRRRARPHAHRHADRVGSLRWLAEPDGCRRTVEIQCCDAHSLDSGALVPAR